MEVANKTREHKIDNQISWLKYQAPTKTGIKKINCVKSDKTTAFLENEYLSILAGKKRIILCEIHPERTAVIINIALSQIENLPYPSEPSKRLKIGIESPDIDAGNIMLIR